jgi:replication fork clamp-binding protein CrfC
MINNLEGYIIEEKIKKLRKRNLRDDLDNYLEDKFDPSLVYDKNTSLKDIKNDVMVKWIITNSLGENTKKIIEGNGKTAHQTWTTFEKYFTRVQRKGNWKSKNKINNLKYNENDIYSFMCQTSYFPTLGRQSRWKRINYS